MPTNRRRRRRTHDAAAEAQAWAMVFKAGHDYFGELRDLGTVALDEYGRPTRDDAAEAWARLGPHYLAGHPADPVQEPWALRTFGQPGSRQPADEGRVRQADEPDEDPTERFFQ